MKNNLRKTVIALIFVCINAIASAAQQPETPEQFAERYFAASAAKDWATLASLTDTGAREDLKKFFRDLLAADTSMKIAKLYFDIQSLQDFDALSSETVYERFFRSLLASNPEFADALSNSRMRVIGSVRDGDSLAYVVYRVEIGISGIPFSEVGVLPMKLNESLWRGLLTADVTKLGQLIQKGIANTPAVQKAQTPNRRAKPKRKGMIK